MSDGTDSLSFNPASLPLFVYCFYNRFLWTISSCFLAFCVFILSTFPLEKPSAIFVDGVPLRISPQSHSSQKQYLQGLRVLYISLSLSFPLFPPSNFLLPICSYSSREQWEQTNWDGYSVPITLSRTQSSDLGEIPNKFEIYKLIIKRLCSATQILLTAFDSRIEMQFPFTWRNVRAWTLTCLVMGESTTRERQHSLHFP